MEHAVAIGEWNYTNAFFLYFLAAGTPLGGWLYFGVERVFHMTAADVPRSQNSWVANRIWVLLAEAIVATWLVPVMPHGNEWAWATAAVLFAQSAYFTSKARRQFLDWIVERHDTVGNK